MGAEKKKIIDIGDHFLSYGFSYKEVEELIELYTSDSLYTRTLVKNHINRHKEIGNNLSEKDKTFLDGLEKQLIKIIENSKIKKEKKKKRKEESKVVYLSEARKILQSKETKIKAIR